MARTNLNQKGGEVKMDKTKQKRKLTIFRYALACVNRTVFTQIDNLCRTIINVSEAIHWHKETLDDWQKETRDVRIRQLRLDLVSTIESAQELLMVLQELETWREETLDSSASTSQNETNKEDKKNE